jgi:hypothetical protein
MFHTLHYKVWAPHLAGIFRARLAALPSRGLASPTRPYARMARRQRDIALLPWLHLTCVERAFIADQLVDMQRGGERGNQYAGGKRSKEGLPPMKLISIANVARLGRVRSKKPLTTCSIQAPYSGIG